MDVTTLSEPKRELLKIVERYHGLWAYDEPSENQLSLFRALRELEAQGFVVVLRQKDNAYLYVCKD